jgi:hypothetical protein
VLMPVASTVRHTMSFLFHADAPTDPAWPLQLLSVDLVGQPCFMFVMGITPDGSPGRTNWGKRFRGQDPAFTPLAIQLSDDPI